MRLLIFFLFLVSSITMGFAQDQPFINEIKAFRAADENRPPKEGCVIFVGSSSIRLWRNLEKDFTHYKVVNRGFGGSTFKEAIMYAHDLVLKHKPSAVFVYEGDNDISNGTPVAEVSEDAKLFAAIVRSKHPNIPIIFISPKPSIARWDLREHYESLNKELKEWTSKQPNTFFLNVWDPMLDRRGKPLPDIFLSDNLHMNAKGYAIWKKEIGGFLSMVVPD